MKETGLLFKAEMVRALLAGIKRQTRRVVKPQPSATFCQQKDSDTNRQVIAAGIRLLLLRDGSPYGVPGDRLWVRETWTPADRMMRHEEVDPPYYVAFRADGSILSPDGPIARKDVQDRLDGAKWRPAIFLPRILSRLTLEITEVRVERVQDISELDARAEGAPKMSTRLDGPPMEAHDGYCWIGYRELWNSINAKPKPLYAFGKIASYVSYPWEDVNEEREHRGKPWRVVGNPYVFAISFRRIHG